MIVLDTCFEPDALARLDAIDGAPVAHIKPVLKGFLPRGGVVEPVWATEIMANYW